MKYQKFYLAPPSWCMSEYRDVYNQDDIDSVPEDWGVTSAECDYIGIFKSHEEAIKEAKKNPDWVTEMRG